MSSRIEQYAESVLAAVQGYVSRSLAAYSKRIDELAAKVAAVPAVKDGRDGIDGKDGTAGRDGVDGKDGAPGTDGKDGINGADGKDGAAGINGKDGIDGIHGKDGINGIDGKNGIDGLIGKDGTNGINGEKGIDGRDGKDGRDGREGKDGEPGRDAADLEILSAINPEKSYPRGTWAKHAGGVWVSRSATQAMDGWDCVVEGYPAIAVVQVNERNFVVEAKTSTGRVEKAEFTMPVFIHRGLWKEVEYEHGDLVTWGGSAFHAVRKTLPTEKPAESDAWQLVVQRGRNGK